MRPAAQPGAEYRETLRPCARARPTHLRPYCPTLVDPYGDHLRKRRAEDPAVPGLQLLTEIKALGYTGSQNLLYRYITQGRVESERAHLSPRRVTRLLVTKPET